MIEPQMDERRSAHVRANLVSFVEFTELAASAPRSERPRQWRLALVTAAVLALVISLSIATLAATGSLGPQPAASIAGPSQSFSASFCALAPVQPFDCRTYRSVSGSDTGEPVDWLASAPVEGRFESTGGRLHFTLEGPQKRSVILVERTASGGSGLASGDSSSARLDCAAAVSACGHESWLLQFFDRPTVLTLQNGALIIRSDDRTITFATTAETPSPSPTQSSDQTPPAAGLLPVVWHVHDAAGEGAATWLRFDVHEIDVLRPNGYVIVSWSTRGNRMLAAISTWYDKLSGADTTAPWLTSSTRFERDAAGWRLLDDAGRVTARLTNDGPPPPSKVILETPVHVTSAVRQDLADAVVAPDAGFEAGASIVGTWGLPGVDPSRASVTFTAQGHWKSIESCDLGGRPQGTGSTYRLSPDGWFLAASALIAGNACFASPSPTPAVSAMTGIGTARSVRVTATELVVFDGSGTQVGVLIRVP